MRSDVIHRAELHIFPDYVYLRANLSPLILGWNHCTAQLSARFCNNSVRLFRHEASVVPVD